MKLELCDLCATGGQMLWNQWFYVFNYFPVFFKIQILVGEMIVPSMYITSAPFYFHFLGVYSIICVNRGLKLL